MSQGTSRVFRRNLTFDPIICPVGKTPIATQVGKARLNAAKGITSFRVVNPNPFWIWLRGWTGQASAMPQIRDMGHYVGPGQSLTASSQFPDWVAVQASAEPGFPLQSAQGDLYPSNEGGVMTDNGAPLRVVLIYGSGD